MITICLATYNGEKYLAEQIESLLNQTFTEWILLIHDDNSKDKTVDIIKEYIKQYPEKIKYIDDYISYGGASQNFSFLLEQTNTEYIMFCDQDDVWLDTKIEETINKMHEIEKSNKDEAILIFTDLLVVDKNLKVINKSFWKYQKLNPDISQSINKILSQNVVTGSTIMINKKAKEISLPMKINSFMHDHWLAINVCKYGKISYLDAALIKYRQHDVNELGALRVDFKYFKLKIKIFLKNLKKYNDLNFDIPITQVVFWKIYLNLLRLF